MKGESFEAHEKLTKRVKRIKKRQVKVRQSHFKNQLDDQEMTETREKEGGDEEEDWYERYL